MLKKALPKKKIGIDFDDVLMDFNDALFGHYNKVDGTNFKKEDIQSFDLEATWGCSREEAVEKTFKFFHTDSHHNANIIEGAIHATKKLKEKYDLIIITSRPETIEKQTLAWLTKNFEDAFSKVIFTNHFHGDASKRISKAEVCKKEGIDVFIDDYVNNVVSVANEGIKSFLFDTPWNQEKIPDNIIRVFSWEDFVSKIF